MNEKLPPQDYFSWHYFWYLPNFINDKLKQISRIPETFNFALILKTLFAPYRRIAVAPKGQKYGASSLLDRITFNLISITIGFCVRIVLLISGLLMIIIFTLFDLLAILISAIFPFFSLLPYIKFKNQTFWEKDLKEPSLFLKKILKGPFFAYLSLFFDQNFNRVFANFPQPATLGLAVSQKPPETAQTLYEKWAPLKNYLELQSIGKEDIDILFSYLDDITKPREAKIRSAFGQSLAFGYTNNLDNFAVEISANRLPSKTKLPFLLEIEKVLLRPKENNVLLVGEPGVGKHNTTEELAGAAKSGLIPALGQKRFMTLDTVSLAGSGKTIGEAKAVFEAVLAEASQAGNIVLVIDHIDRIASSRDERIDLTEVLTVTLKDNSLPIIGLTSPDNFAKYIRPNPSFTNLFEKIDLEETSYPETLSVLIAKSIENFAQTKIKTTLSALVEIAKKSSRIVVDRKQPEKSIILLTDAQAEAKSRNQNLVDVELVDEIIARRTKTPIGKITEGESAKLKDLEKLLHQRVIGQEEAIVEIAKAMRRARAEIEAGNRPIGSFLFLGLTGVGKTETAKALAEAYFGGEDKMVRLDMSEYQSDDSVRRLIGEVENSTPGILANLIREHPYGLLLLDEFEKASKNVHNLFLQVFDEGFMTDAFGKKVSFDNVIIIATSNAGAEFIREQLTETPPRGEVKAPPGKHPGGVQSQGSTLSSTQGRSLSKEIVDYVLTQNLFSPELINRFDAVVVYRPLAPEQVVSVARLMLTSLAKKLKETKDITLEITDDLAKKVAEAGYEPEFGARPVRRLIADKIEDGIAKLIINGTAKSGSKIDAKTLLAFLS